MIYLSDKIQGWVQNGPTGNDLMQNVLDWLIGPQLERDIQAVGTGSPEKEGAYFWDKYIDQVIKEVSGGDYSLSNQPPSGSQEEFVFGQQVRARLQQDGMHFQGQEQGSYDYSYDQLSSNSREKLENIINEGGLEEFGGYSFDEIGYNPQSATIDPLSQQSIIENIPGYGAKYRAGDINPSLDVVQPLDINKLMQIKPGYYSSDVSKARQPLSQMLHEKRQTARGAGGGFEGYGKRSGLEDIAEGSYLGKVEDIYSGVDVKRQSAVDDIYAQLTDWASLEDTI